jgi:hypothetical protein
MTTDCNTPEFTFQGLGSRVVTARFDGGAITSDAGGLLLREVEAKTGILRRFAACFTDHRDPELIEHTVPDLIAQRVLVGKSLAGKSTLNRLELTPVGADAKSRYKKIVARHHDLEAFFVETFLALHPTPSKEIVLAVHFLRRTSVVRQAAAGGHRRRGRLGEATGEDRRTDSSPLARRADHRARTSRIRRGRVGVAHVAWWARPNTWPRGAIRDSW